MDRMKKWVSLLLVLMLALGNVLSATAEDAAAVSAPIQLPVLLAADNGQNAGTDGMEGLLKEIVIKDEKGQAIRNGDTVYLGEKYTFSLSFQENGPYKQFVLQEDGTLVYQFPADVRIQDTSDYPVFNGTTKIGHYTVRDNRMVFTPYYTKDGNTFTAEKTEGSYSIVEFYGNAWLNFEFEGSFTAEGKKKDIPFGGTAKVEVDVEQRAPTPKLDVKKESFVSEDRKAIQYTVTAKVTEANADDLVIKG